MSKDAFKDMLDGMAAEDAPVVEPQPVVVLEVEEMGNGLAEDDPYKHLVGRRLVDVEERDPFTAMLDGMMLLEGVDKTTETGPKNPEAENHNWESDKIAIFEEDELLMTCSKCCRQMRMSRKESTNASMDRHNIARDCSMQTVGEVMNE